MIVFVAGNPNNGQPPNAASILELHPNLPTGVLFRADGGEVVTFLATGFPQAGVNMTNAVFCDLRGLQPGTPTTGRALLLSPTGRGTVVNSFAAVNAALAATGGTCP